ncbi:PREDICTED: serine--tRNA ligase, mitochondrial [Ceratosolen solmsi marchali]|uniref:serine--tRNA ligase n=1 Tax=Ceratosolen solmsi marchali TaxID=326594 RepID=A0AAJ7DUV6_9HYME|nr:PREDICTED: serine--tRNA ligase, mitochondrial [Ceratosolen solmsi marchali]
MKKITKYIIRILNMTRFYTNTTFKQKIHSIPEPEIHLPKPEYNIEFLCNPLNRDLIADNIKKRKSSGNIDKVLEFHRKANSKKLFEELSKIPNLTQSTTMKYLENIPTILRIIGNLPKYDFKAKEFSNIATNLNLLINNHLGPVTGSRSYVLIGDLAELEQALIMYTIKELLSHNFHLVSVPDILPSQILERCGLINDGDRKLVYEIEPYYGNVFSLSGTAEMALAYKLSNKVFSYDELPIKLVAVSRCYRAEISNLVEERGIYRVHQFTKVEMFVASEQKHSIKIMEEIISIQEKLFGQLNLHCKLLDMPSNELGSSAYRKIDIEAWMPGRARFGEISSCSNCTDYQSRRLSIKYKNSNGIIIHAHTLNGTACAIPRMLIAICETYQLSNGDIMVPEYLKHFMNKKSIIRKQNIPSVKY